jgi:hypothetical protein
VLVSSFAALEEAFWESRCIQRSYIELPVSRWNESQGTGLSRTACLTRGKCWGWERSTSSWRAVDGGRERRACSGRSDGLT